MDVWEGVYTGVLWGWYWELGWRLDAALWRDGIVHVACALGYGVLRASLIAHIGDDRTEFGRPFPISTISHDTQHYNFIKFACICPKIHRTHPYLEGQL